MRPLWRAAKLLSETTRAPLRGAQQRQQVRGQCEMSEMVTAELQFESVGGGVAFRRSHHPGVVDQDVNRATFGVELFAQRGDAGQ